MKECPHYGEIVNKRDVDRTIEDNKILRKYNQWITEINKQCSKQQNEDEFFQQIFEDTAKYCLV